MGPNGSLSHHVASIFHICYVNSSKLTELGCERELSCIVTLIFLKSKITFDRNKTNPTISGTESTTKSVQKQNSMHFSKGKLFNSTSKPNSAKKISPENTIPQAKRRKVKLYSVRLVSLNGMAALNP